MRVAKWSTYGYVGKGMHEQYPYFRNIAHIFVILWGYVLIWYTCGDCGVATKKGYVEILEFTHFVEFFSFNKIGENHKEKELAVEIDRFTHDYDEILYHDSTRNMTENVSELHDLIQQGDTEHLSIWLNEVISEGVVPDKVEWAKELLEKLAEYKPRKK